MTLQWGTSASFTEVSLFMRKRRWDSDEWIIGQKIIAVIDATLQLPKESLKAFSQLQSCVYNCDDLLSYNSSPRSSHI